MSVDTEKRAGFDKWLRLIADHLYEISEEGTGDRTAAEIESEMQVYLKGELLPLLEMIDAQDGLLICYRLQSLPSDKLLDNLKRLRTKLDKIRNKL